MIKQYVEIKTDFEAIHNWPECPIKDVSFLKHPHRHKIYTTVRISTSEDRQIEFFMLKKEVDEIIDELYTNERLKYLGRKSMEEICLDIINVLKNRYNTFICVTASEDNQVKGIIEYEPDK